jgi:hypothetical protein
MLRWVADEPFFVIILNCGLLGEEISENVNEAVSEDVFENPDRSIIFLIVEKARGETMLIPILFGWYCSR